METLRDTHVDFRLSSYDGYRAAKFAEVVDIILHARYLMYSRLTRGRSYQYHGDGVQAV